MTSSALDNTTAYPLTGIIYAQTKEMAQDAMRAWLWNWFDRNKDVSIKTRIGPIPLSIKVAKLEPLIALIAGARH